MKSFSQLARTLLAGSATTVFCTVAFAQMTPGIQTLNQETTLPFDRIFLNGAPNIPSNILSSITGGALEIRQLIEQRSDGTLRVRHILVPSQSPNPTPAALQNTVIDDYIVRIDNIVRWADVSATPPGTTATGTTAAPTAGSLTFIGTITEEIMTSPFGSLRGRPFIYSIGYQQPSSSTGNTSFRNATLVIPGLLTTFIPSGTGTLTFVGGTPGTPGTPAGPTIGIADRITTLQTDVQLDAMATDAGTGPLTYAWRVVRGSATILEPTAARTRVQVPAIFGEHLLEVKVTNAAGQSTTKQFTIVFAGSSGF